MEKDMEQLRQKVLTCQNCPLWETRQNVVFGAGNPNAEVLFIGEGPGEQEDKQGEPFVGRSGILLDKMLAAIDLSRDKNVYIANMVKCRPPKNRDPKPEEVAACIDYLRCQTRLISPKIIVCLGRVAAQYLISPTFKVTQQHGQFHQKNGIYMGATFHPSALLRNPANKPAAMEDFFTLRELIRVVCQHTY